MRTSILGGIIAVCLLFTPTHASHAIGTIVQVTLAPTEISVTAGEKTTFTVTGVDPAGQSVNLSTNSTLTTTDPRGSFSGNVLTSGKVGRWIVTVTYGSITNSATVNVSPGNLSELVVNPNSDPEYFMLNESRKFSAEGFDASNNKITGLNISWTVKGGNGTIASTGKSTATFTALHQGTERVIAQSGDITSSIVVQVITESEVGINTNTTSGNLNTSGKTTNSALNTNSASNLNVASTDTSDQQSSTVQKTCKSWTKLTWIAIFAAYLLALVLSLLWMRRIKPSWWWLLPLLCTVATLWIYFQFRCYPLLPGLPYLILIAAIIGTSWYTWQRSSIVK